MLETLFVWNNFLHHPDLSLSLLLSLSLSVALTIFDFLALARMGFVTSVFDNALFVGEGSLRSWGPGTLGS